MDERVKMGSVHGSSEEDGALESGGNAMDRDRLCTAFQPLLGGVFFSHRRGAWKTMNSFLFLFASLLFFPSTKQSFIPFIHFGLSFFFIDRV